MLIYSVAASPGKASVHSSSARCREMTPAYARKGIKDTPTVRKSDRDRIGAELAEEAVLGALGEFRLLGQHDRAGAHALRFRRQARDFLAVLVGLDRAQ